ncbi:uncharacterized protein LOC100882427 isoform X2 [Megachile rotundata]
MKNLIMLQCLMHQDCEETVIGRTQRSLLSIGIVSTFFTLPPDVLKKLQEFTNCNVIEFLRETYKILTGNYFEEEKYKEFYGCNERIILSAIAFLTLPETVVELHKRLPPVIMPELPPKPTLSVPPPRQKMDSPYEENLFVRPDWASYLNQLQYWQQQYQLLPLPKVILPPKDCVLTNYKKTRDDEYSQFNVFKYDPQEMQKPNVLMRRKQNVNTSTNTESKYGTPIKVKTDDINDSANNPNIVEENVMSVNVPINTTAVQQTKRVREENDSIDSTSEESEQGSIEDDTVNNTGYNEKVATLDVPPLYGGNRLFDFTINGICEKSGPVQYKLCGVLQPPRPNRKSWLGEKHAHYIISGAADDPPTCPITYEMTGVANVTPTNSDERFLAVLKLGDGPKKIYPSGRKNLSRHWQEWLQNVDEEFRKVEREANKMIKDIEAITKLVFPKPTCDSCCSCRQTRKSYLKAKETKAPYFVIDTITEDDNKNKYIIGSMALHSPAPTPPESTTNLLEIIASEDVLTSNLVINGVTNEEGETQYFISGTREDVVRVPRRIVERPPPPPPRNVPPCVCAIQQIFNKDITPTLSQDNIPWTKQDGLCFGKKFRPDEAGAYSCKKYPGDKSCRRNPFRREIINQRQRAERAKQEKEKDFSKKKMYSIADFKPCGDEHGMGICGGPWGAVHTLTAEELAEEERLRKEILRGPPCGTRPGRAVCEGPFGKRISIKPQKRIEIEDEIPGEEDLDEEEIEEEEEEEKIKEPPVKKEKEKKRQKECYTSPESIAAKKQVMEKKVKKFIPDPTYPGYDDPWNVFRTAPSEKESETNFKELLKLSSPKPPATPVQSKVTLSESKYISSVSQKPISDSNIKKDTSKVVRKSVPVKSKSSQEVVKKKSVSTVKRGTQIEMKKASKETLRSAKLDEKTDRKLAKPTKDKHDYRKISTKTMSVKHLKKGNHVRKSSKPTVENPKLKSKREKPTAVKEASSVKFNIKTKKKEEMLESSKISKSKKSERKLSNSGNIKRSKVEKAKRLSNKSIVPPNVARRETAKSFSEKKRPIKQDKRKDTQTIQHEDSDIFRRNQIENLKSMLKSSDLYPYDVKPVDLPEEPKAKCQPEYEYTETVDDSAKVDEDADKQLPSKGPCGWRTKSEQKLPTKKTLVHLTEPDYPPQTVPVRPGGKPCLCRENRAKKKILKYNIGGVLDKKKDDEGKKLFRKKKDEDDKQMQVIDGLIYYTPPPSPRRSDEYVPEYDLYKSPYDMCLTQRKDRGLKFIERYSRPQISEGPKNQDSCGCNEFIDTYGIQTTIDQKNEEFDKIREEFVNAKPPKERWKLAVNDVGLIDYFTRCRDSMPCWLKCAQFNKVGCPLPLPKLQTIRPVCECKYERKILENNEEKQRWKERRKKLKSLKKEPFKNVTDISKPIVANTKLVISDVKRIPRENEYIDDIKYCITGVAENYSELPPTQVVGGIHMSTPIQTPEPSEEKLPCVCSHKHWSAVSVPPGPLPKPEEILLADKKRRQEAVIEAFKQIYAPQQVYDTHDGHSCKEPCIPDSDDNDLVSMQSRGNIGMRSRLMSQKQRRSELKNTDKRKKLSTVQKTTERSIKSSRKETRTVKNEGNSQKYSPNPQTYEYQNIIQSQKESTDSNMEDVDISDENIEDDIFDTGDPFMIVVQVELKKMASEGFLFAKLPECFFMPQLQYWLMYRKGFSLSDADKHKSVTETTLTWNMLDTKRLPKIKPPPIELEKHEIHKLTFDSAKKMKEKIALKKQIFYNEVRNHRVLYARLMWNTMEYGKFPSTSFKQAYFTYMSSKETDGHVFKPWLPCEAKDMS